MPTVFREGAFRFFFWSLDEGEPPHVHVERDECFAKFWIDPVELEYQRGFNTPDLNSICETVEERREEILAAWNKHFKR
jgi:hypothetical protein